MTCYIAHYTKKRDRRKRLEHRLKVSISQGNWDKADKFAKEIRDARIRELRAIRATIPPVGSESFDKINAKISVAETTTPEEIIAEFMGWFLYVVSCRDKTLYTGVTTNLDRRVGEHNFSRRGAKYTRSRRPVRLVASWPYPNRSEAQKAEYKFKRLSRQQKLERVKSGSLPF